MNTFRQFLGRYTFYAIFATLALAATVLFFSVASIAHADWPHVTTDETTEEGGTVTQEGSVTIHVGCDNGGSADFDAESGTVLGGTDSDGNDRTAGETVESGWADDFSDVDTTNADSVTYTVVYTDGTVTTGSGL